LGASRKKGTKGRRAKRLHLGKIKKQRPKTSLDVKGPAVGGKR